MPGMIEALHRLQDIEKELAVIRREEDARRQRIEQSQRQVLQIERQIADLLNQKRQLQIAADAIELDMKAREATIAKHREALTQAKSTREYSAILTTINTEKADCSKIESSALEQMTKLDGLKNRIGELEAERQARVERFQRNETSLAEYQRQVFEERQRLEGLKREAATGLSATSLQTFERVAQHHDGEAMAEVTKMNPRRDEYCCGGCNMKISLEVVNALQTKDELQFCQVCGRVLFLPTAAAKAVR